MLIRPTQEPSRSQLPLSPRFVHSVDTRQGPSQKTTDDYKKINERLPTADYDDKQDLPDPEKNAKRKEKQKRYNDTDLVASHIESMVDEAALFLEPHFTFPALPVVEREIVVVGTIALQV